MCGADCGGMSWCRNVFRKVQESCVVDAEVVRIVLGVIVAISLRTTHNTQEMRINVARTIVTLLTIVTMYEISEHLFIVRYSFEFIV